MKPAKQLNPREVKDLARYGYQNAAGRSAVEVQTVAAGVVFYLLTHADGTAHQIKVTSMPHSIVAPAVATEGAPSSESAPEVRE